MTHRIFYQLMDELLDLIRIDYLRSSNYNRSQIEEIKKD